MRKIGGAALFVIGVALLSRLGQSDFEFPLDADFRANSMTEWRHFFTSLSPLSKPLAYAYFDGQLIANGLVGALLKILASAFRPLRDWFPNDDAYSVGAALIVSYASYAAACTVFYAALLRAGANVAIAAIAAVAMLLSPQVLDMPMLRQDFLITFPMMVVFYCSVVLARGEERMRHAVVLGLALGALSTIKLTGPMFGLLPALAVVSRFRAALADWRHMLRFIGIALIVFVAVYLVLMGRFVYYYTLAEWLALYPAGMNAFTSWREILPWDFSLYYNDELVRGHGVEFIALYAVCTVALALVAIRERDSTAAFLVLSLIAYSLYSASTMKYARGGYHLIPLFLAVIAYTAAWLWRAQRFAPLRYAALAIIGLTMASSLSKSFAHYQARAENVQEVSATLGDLWRPAQQWLKANIAPSDRICIEIHSEWTLPLNDMAAQTTYGPFAYPYTESAALSRNEPPEDAVVKAACDFIVSGGAHRFLFDWRRRHGDVANAERWVAYFRALPERFPRVRFETKRKVWLTQWIEIYRIKGAPNTPR